MRTAVDSSVLLCILRRQPGSEAWRAALSRAAEDGGLLLCPAVFAECSVGFSHAKEAEVRFDSPGIVYDAFTPECAYLAGQIFLRYRREGGSHQQLLPDFLIAAHASVQADRLAAMDRGYLRTYFPALALLTPAEKRYLRAMAELGAGPHRSGDIARPDTKSVDRQRHDLSRKQGSGRWADLFDDWS